MEVLAFEVDVAASFALALPDVVSPCWKRGFHLKFVLFGPKRSVTSLSSASACGLSE